MFLFRGTDLSFFFFFFDLFFLVSSCLNFDLYPRISVVSAAIDGKRSDLQNFNWIGFPAIFDRWKFFSNFKSFPILSDLHQNFSGFFFLMEKEVF